MVQKRVFSRKNCVTVYFRSTFEDISYTACTLGFQYPHNCARVAQQIGPRLSLYGSNAKC
jgi:hypothetical protein